MSKQMPPLPTWERVAVGALFSALSFCFLSCLLSIDHIAFPIIHLILAAAPRTPDVAVVIIADGTTGAIIGGACAGMIPVILKRKRAVKNPD